MCRLCEVPCVRDGGERECCLTDLQWAYEMGDIDLREYLRAIGFNDPSKNQSPAGAAVSRSTEERE